MRVITTRASRARSITPAVTLTLDDTTLSIDQGATLAGTATVVTQNYLGYLTFAFNGLPTGVTASVGDPTFVTGTTRIYPVTYTAAADASVVSNDAFDVVVTGRDVTDTESATVTVVLVSPEAIEISAIDPTVQVTQGSTITIPVALNRLFGYTGTVTLAVTGLPSGVSASYPSGNTYSGTTALLDVVLTATGGATEVTDDAFVVEATGTGVDPVTINGTVTVVASAGGPAPYRSDDFSTYADTAALRTAIQGGNPTLYISTVNPTLVDLDPTVTFDGHATMRYNFPPSSSSTPQVAARTGGLGHVWVRTTIRFAPGFTTAGDGTGGGGGGAYKFQFLMWNPENGVASDGRSGIEFSQINKYVSFTGFTPRGSTAIFDYCKNVVAPVGSGYYAVTNEWTDGEWYDYLLHHERTDPSSGRFTWYKKLASDPDASYVKIQTGVRTASGGLLWPTTAKFQMGLNWNQPRTAVQNPQLWYGRWEVYDGDTYANPFGVTL